MPDIFLSYSREDQATARRFAEGFEREDLTVWWDQALNPGEAFDEVTEKALNEAKAVVVLWSKKSVASRWVRAEATQANENKTLVPVMIEPCKRPIMFELTHTANLSHWNGDPSDAGWQTFLAGVKRLAGRDASGTSSPSAASTGAGRPRRFGAGTLAGIVAAILIAGIGVWVVGRHGSKSAAAKPLAPAAMAPASPAPAREVTLAVMPFVNLSSDPEQDYFSDGLSEEILNQLTQYKDLRVIGRASSYSLKGKDDDPRVVGEKLGVVNLLKGSVRKSGNDLRITATLVSCKDGANLWSETYARKLANIFAVQEEIAKAVASALRVKLAPEQDGVVVGGTTNPQAYDAYLSAKAIGRDIKTFNSQLAIAPLERAVALDPNFANAWAFLAAKYGFDAKGSAALARALELAPKSPVVLMTASAASMLNHDWQAAERQSLEALALAPTLDYEANRGYAWFLMTVGRPKESYAYWERAKRAEPLLTQPSLLFATSYGMAFDIARSDAELEHARSLEVDQSQFAGSEIERALLRRDQAALSKLLVNKSGVFELLRQGLANPPVALAGLRKLVNDPASRSDQFLMIGVAEVAAYFGDLQLALQAVNALSNLAFSSLIWQPGLTQVRQLPGFKDVVRDMKLVDYWRSSGNWGDFCKPVGKDDFECH